MSTLTLTQFDRIPTISALLGTQGHREILDQINTEMGTASYFGSSDDPFSTQHQYFIDRVVAPIQQVARQFKQQYKELLHPKECNVFKPIRSLEDLEEGIPECMWEAVAMHPVVREYGKQHRVDLFGMDVVNLPKENPYERLMRNGVASFTAEELKANGGKYTVEFEYHSDDPQLTDDELDDLRDTYDFITSFYHDLDELYEKLNKTHLLREKSYLDEGTQLRDLDITAFPNRKG